MIERLRVKAGGRHRSRRAALWPAWVADERGSVTVMVALSVTALAAMLALAIDLAALFDARSEAQRAADAAALAGASAFLEYHDAYARSIAIDRAMDFATSNVIRGELIDPEDVTVTVDLDSATVRAHIRRDGVATWFARLVGIESVDIGAEATAWAGAAGAAQCLKPFAVPDMWEETNDDLNGNRIWDAGERWRFDSDQDRYTPYSGTGGGHGETGYGSDWRNGYTDALGRTYPADYGRRITVKTTNPQETLMPSFFLPWVLPADQNQPECGGTRRPGGGSAGGGGAGGGAGGGPGGGDPGPGNGASGGSGSDGGSGWFRWSERRDGLGGSAGQGGRDRGRGSGGSNGGGSDGGGSDGGGSNGGGGSDGGGSAGGGGAGAGTGTSGRDNGSGRGAASYRRNICSCNASLIDFDTEYMIEPGNMVGPTYQGVATLIAQDPTAYWDDRSNTIVSDYGMDSPRVVTVALFDPSQISQPGRQYIRFNNFARIFIEAQASPQDPVTGRMLYYVRGVGSSSRNGATTGSLVRTLQLIR